MVFAVIRMIHILSGISALLLGTAAILTPKRRGPHVNLGGAYFAFIRVIAATAIALSVIHWRESWFFAVIAVVSYGYAYRGVKAMRERKPGWLAAHIEGMLGSYIAIWTAFMVTSGAKFPGLAELPGWVRWVLPTLIGVPISRIVRQRLAPKQATG